MSKLTALQLKAFRDANNAAYKAASGIFKDIEGRSYDLDLANVGIIGDDVRVYATMYVAEQSDVMPHEGKRGGLTFVKDTPEYNRVRYLVSVINGTRSGYVSNSKTKAAQTKQRISKAHRDAAMRFCAEFEGASLAEQIKAAKAVLNALL